MAVTTGAAGPRIDRRHWNSWRRMQYVGSTLAIELVLGCVISLVSIIGSFFTPLKLTIVTHHEVTESGLTPSVLAERIRTTWSGPGTATARPMSDTGTVVDGGCSPHALEIETTVRTGVWGGGDLLSEIERAAHQVGLGMPCDGLQIRTRPVLTLQAVLTTGTSVVAPLLMFLVWRSRRGRPWLIDWADWTPRVNLHGALRWGVAMGAVAIACAFSIDWLGQLAGLAGGSESMLTAGKTRTELLWLAPLFVFGAPIFEEYVFRAWMLERFSRAMPAWLALVSTALAFAAMHVPQGAVPALELTIGGVLLGLTWLWTRSWLACALAHGLYNGAVLLALWIALPS